MPSKKTRPRGAAPAVAVFERFEGGQFVRVFRLDRGARRQLAAAASVLRSAWAVLPAGPLSGACLQMATALGKLPALECVEVPGRAVQTRQAPGAAPDGKSAGAGA